MVAKAHQRNNFRCFRVPTSYYLSWLSPNLIAAMPTTHHGNPLKEEKDVFSYVIYWGFAPHLLYELHHHQINFNQTLVYTNTKPKHKYL